MDTANLPVAGAGKRFLGELIDNILVTIVAFPGIVFLIMALGEAFSSIDSSSGNGNVAGGYLLIAITFFIGSLIFNVYNTCFFPNREKTRGQTIGQKALDIKAVKLDGTPFTAGTGFLRNLFGKSILPSIIGWIISVILIVVIGGEAQGLVFFFYLAYYLSLFYGGVLKQAFWDKIAKTVMVDAINQHMDPAIVDVPPAPSPPTPPAPPAPTIPLHSPTPYVPDPPTPPAPDNPAA